MASLGDTIIRVILLVFSITALGLTAAWVHDETHSSRVRFAVFSSAFSILIGFYGLLADFIELLAYPIGLAVADFLNWVFLFTGATAIAAKIGAGSCSNHRNLVKHFEKASSKDCRMAQAGTAFLYFAWAAAVGNFIYSVLAVLGSGSVGMPSARKHTYPRTGVPTMSQV